MTINPGMPNVITSWSVPVASGGALLVEARAGEVVTVLGPNGSGKSALATWMTAEARTVEVKRVLAHRKLWFQHSGPSISSADREQYTTNITSWDRHANSRYLDYADGQRSSIALFDLLGHLNHESRTVAGLYDSGATRAEVDAEVGGRLLDVVNAILEHAGLHLALELTSTDSFVARHRTLGVEYPIYLMSDGEKSALLLAADVLTAATGAVVIIDEPERHLHRSISAGLIEAIVAARPDCGFVVMTHDLDLAATLSERAGTTISVSGVEWNGPAPARWDMHEVPDPAGLSETARRAILGGRRRILFIEGDHESIDLALYGVLFPDWLLVPSGSCDLVIRSVSGLRGSQDHHWIHAVGIVDGDGRSQEERDSLEGRGIRVLPVSEIENIYYDPRVIDDVAVRQAGTLGGDAADLIAVVKQRALAALATAGTPERLAAKLAKDQVARQLLAHMPGTVGNADIEIAFASPFAGILSTLNGLIEAGDYEELVRVAPIRDTAVRNATATALGFRSVADYQRAALVAITESAALRESLGVAVGDPSALADLTPADAAPAAP